MYRIEYESSVVEEDIPALPKAIHGRIRKAIEEKLVNAPVSFGKPLQYSMKGLRRLRVGNYRIIFAIEEAQKTVVILKIGHRREVYE